jgi:hypothetical protein
MKQETPIPYQLLAELLKLRGESQQADWSKALELLHMLEDPIESSKSQIKAPKLKEQKGDEVDQSNYTSLAISDSSTNLERLLMKSKLLQTNADLIAFGRAALNIDLTVCPRNFKTQRREEDRNSKALRFDWKCFK